jgi:hypothetical protein
LGPESKLSTASISGQMGVPHFISSASGSCNFTPVRYHNETVMADSDGRVRPTR